MLRSHTCGELRTENVNEEVVLCGWIQRIRDKGGMMWLDLRDRYGLTQLILEEGKSSKELLKTVRSMGREFVIQAKGTVVERFAKISIKNNDLKPISISSPSNWHLMRSCAEIEKSIS